VGRILGDGALIRVPAGALVAVICSTDRYVRLQPTTAWRLSQSQCNLGREVAGAYRSLTTNRGRVVTNSAGSAVLVRPGTRGSDASLVISPRGWEREDRPDVEWILYSGASEYEVTLSQGNPATVIETRVMPAEGLDSAKTRSDQVLGSRIYRMAWPFAVPLTRDTTPYQLTVTARAGSEEIHETTRLRMVSDQMAQSLASRLGLIRELQLDSVSRALLLGAAFANDSLFGEAAEYYRRVFAMLPSPELQVTLGDLSRADGFPRMAQLWYEAAATHAASTRNAPAEAAGRHGLGLVLLEEGRFEDAESELRKAAALFTRMGWTDQAAGADSAAMKAHEGKVE
jgi:hypothetical protein